MAAVSQSALDVDGKGCISTLTGVSWDHTPTELLFYIFKKLDIQSLRCCIHVSRRWKEIAKNLCEKQDLWHALAEDGMVNYGVQHQFKSTLGWRDLYFNSLLWNNLQSATFNKIHETGTLYVKNMHVYRGKLIVIVPNGIKYYDIESFLQISFYPSEMCEDYQETDEIFMIVTNNTRYFTATVFVKEDKDELIDIGKYFHPVYLGMNNNNTQFTVTSRRWRLVGNCGYVIDSRCVLWTCFSRQGSLEVNALSRYYGDLQLSSGSSLSSLHVSKQDVYIASKWGDLMVVRKGDMSFRKVNTSEIPTFRIENPDAYKRQPSQEAADKFDAFITIPFGVGFPEGLSSKYLVHFHYNDPTMTAGVQHGDVVFRGFDDGRIVITILRNNFKLELNVKQFDEGVTDPAVIGLDVCELKGMHKLFVATATKLYTILLTYPDHLLEP